MEYSHYLKIRSRTEELCEFLTIEDFVVQPCAEVSPPKWHLGHTTWFFEKMILEKWDKSWSSIDSSYDLIFNSYYKTIGPHWVQGNRGVLSRPSVSEVLDYRKRVDIAMKGVIDRCPEDRDIQSLLEIGCHHEQQHQELLLMDIKSILSQNVIVPKFKDSPLDRSSKDLVSWSSYHKEEVVEIGAIGSSFCYDNETPRHKVYRYPFAIQNQLVTNGEYMEFISDKGYECSQFWLSKGWDWKSENKIVQPLYWESRDGVWYEKTLHGTQPLDLCGPLSHISMFEADAFSKWSGSRLPTETELEYYLDSVNAERNHDRYICENTETYHATDSSAVAGQLWCWTQSQYSPYPGFQTFKNGLSEYNGKFMCNQFVLKGGSVVTPSNHYRNSYRNFYEPHQRWMFSGIRLAKDLL